MESLPESGDAAHRDHVREEFTVEIHRLYAMFAITARRPWWTRVWIVQECILPEKSPVVQCGNKSLLWADFFQALWKTQRFQIRTKPGSWDHPSVLEIYQSIGLSYAECSGGFPFLELLDIMRMEYAKHRRPYSFSMIMSPFLGRKASVAHDFVYGLLGLVSEENRQAIPVDYERPCWEIYKEFTKAVLQCQDPGSRAILSSVSFQSPRDLPDRPTWVPDYSSQFNHNDDNRQYSGILLALNDCWRTLECRFSDDANTLILTGVYLDVIDKVYQFGEDKADIVNVVEHMEQKARSILKRQRKKVRNGGPEPLFKSANSSLRRMFTLDAFEPAVAGVASEQLDFWWDVFQTPGHPRWDDLVEPESKRVREELDGRSTSELITGMLRQARTACLGRCLVGTRTESLVGVCVPGAQKGDAVACLAGMPMPWSSARWRARATTLSSAVHLSTALRTGPSRRSVTKRGGCAQPLSEFAKHIVSNICASEAIEAYCPAYDIARLRQSQVCCLAEKPLINGLPIVTHPKNSTNGSCGNGFSTARGGGHIDARFVLGTKAVTTQFICRQSVFARSVTRGRLPSGADAGLALTPSPTVLGPQRPYAPFQAKNRLRGILEAKISRPSRPLGADRLGPPLDNPRHHPCGSRVDAGRPEVVRLPKMLLLLINVKCSIEIIFKVIYFFLYLFYVS